MHEENRARWKNLERETKYGCIYANVRCLQANIWELEYLALNENKYVAGISET